MSKYQIEFLSTKNNLETVKVNGYLLHSKYDPVREAKIVADREYEAKKVIILFGYGLGYIAEAISNKIDKSQKLIIIDPLYKYLNQFISNHGFNIVYEYDQKSIEYILANALTNLSQQVKIIISPNYEKIFREELVELLNIVKDIQNVHKVMENTIKDFSDSWQENYIHNLIHINQETSLENIKKIYTCPVILVSGGPSLIKQLEILKSIKDHVITIAAGSTINTLLEYSIEPDYIVSIDGGIENYHHFKDIKKIKSELIFSLSSYFKIQDEYPGTKYSFLTLDDEDIQKYIEKVFDIKLPILAGGGSVANFALTIANFITTGPIAIIGQDLAYTDNKSHAEHNKNFVNIDKRYKEENGLFEVEGYNGDKVMTDYPLFSMKKDFERLNDILSQTTMIYNCTEGGVKIERMKQINFLDFCNNYVDKEILLEKKSSMYILNTENYKGSKLIDVLLNEVNIYDELIKSFQFALKILQRNKSKVSFDKNVLKELDKVDKEFIRKKELTSLNRIVDPITMDVMRDFEPVPGENTEEKYKRVFNQNKELYSRLLEAVEKTKKYTLDVLEKQRLLNEV